MRHSLSFATVTVLLAACAPQSRFHDYSTPVHAARSFVEAGRVGDMRSFRESIVAIERDQNLTCDYQDLGDYQLQLDRMIDDDRAVVTMQFGAVSSPLACVRERGDWKISIRGSLICMQQELQDQIASSPR